MRSSTGRRQVYDVSTRLLQQHGPRRQPSSGVVRLDETFYQALATTNGGLWSSHFCQAGAATSTTTAQQRWFHSSPATNRSTKVTFRNSENTKSRIDRTPMKAFRRSDKKPVPNQIALPPYAKTGRVPNVDMNRILLHSKDSVDRMRDAARLARQALNLACTVAVPGMTSDDIDTIVHNALIEMGAYPSPLNYSGFPKSICSSINEVICHGIPDARPLKFGDVVSFDVSCFYYGVHGDNCATIIVGDFESGFDFSTATTTDDRAHGDDDAVDWRGIPYKTDLSPDEQSYMGKARRLVRATREACYAGIETCRPGSCLSEIGNVIQDVADSYGYSTVEKYRGHGISTDFHCAPFVKHFRNEDRLELKPGMIFTIEPMLVMGSGDCFEWGDNWTVATLDGSLAAQFEHTVLITEDSVEILTLS